MTENPYLRQELLFKPELWRPIVIIGIGGIGSWTAVELAKMGAKELRLFDPDTIELHNACYTIYGRHQVGYKKVEILKSLLHRWEGGRGLKIKIFDRPPLSEKDFPKLCIVVIAVDNMDVRKDIWERMVKNNPRVLYLIEGRMGAEAAMVYTVKPLDDSDADFYSRPPILYPQENASRETCAEQSFVFTAATTGSIISSQIKNILIKEKYWSEIILDLKNMRFTTRRLVNPA